MLHYDKVTAAIIFHILFSRSMTWNYELILAKNCMNFHLTSYEIMQSWINNAKQIIKKTFSVIMSFCTKNPKQRKIEIQCKSSGDP